MPDHDTPKVQVFQPFGKIRVQSVEAIVLDPENPGPGRIRLAPIATALVALTPDGQPDMTRSLPAVAIAAIVEGDDDGAVVLFALEPDQMEQFAMLALGVIARARSGAKGAVDA